MRRLFPWAFTLALLATAAPLWAGTHLPAVDAPEHLFLTHVLRSLGDASSPYHATYVAEPRLTYVTFYFFVAGLGGLVGEETALRIWLTLVVVGIPLSVLALLRAFRRSPWLALLACPLAYTDNFYWGLVSFLSSIPLVFLTIAAFVRSLEGERKWTWVLAGSLVALQLTHAAGIIFPAFALPLMLLTTRATWRERGWTVAGVVPGVALFLAWLAVGVHQDRVYGKPGDPWKAVAPLFDARSFAFEPLAGRWHRAWDLLSNGFWDWADRGPLWGWVGLCGVVVAGAAYRAITSGHRALSSGSSPKGRGEHSDANPSADSGESPLSPFGREDGREGSSGRELWLFLLALAAYFLLPTDIHGYMYMLAARYAQVAALLLIPVLGLFSNVGKYFPKKSTHLESAFAVAALALSLWSGVNLTILFARFDRETRSFERLAEMLPHGAKILHLVMDPRSGVATHPVYLHYACLAALRSDGVPSFSLALDPSFPVHYRPDARPPAPPSEWRPQEFSWTTDLPSYDVILAKGDTSRVFAGHERAVERIALDGPWSLWRVTHAP